MLKKLLQTLLASSSLTQLGQHRRMMNGLLVLLCYTILSSTFLICLAESLNEFGRVIYQIEENRTKVIEEAEPLYFVPLQKLIDHISKVVRDEKHTYNKESTRFYTGLEKHLHLSTVRIFTLF